MIDALEGVLFLCGDEGITKEELKKIFEIKDQELSERIAEIKEMCLDDKRGIQIEEYGEILKFVTKPKNEDIYKKLVQVDIERPLTQTALEVLAIVAYNQPITRLEVDELRGVASSHLLRKLLIKELIYEADRAETPGKPIIYRTTSQFLDALGISNLDQLPAITEIEKQEEMELFSKKINENVEEIPNI